MWDISNKHGDNDLAALYTNVHRADKKSQLQGKQTSFLEISNTKKEEEKN